ncbi:hypothetical protein Tco_0223548 [Tanacetum coccineum]
MAKVLEISEWIKTPNVDLNQIRLLVFSNSLDEDAKDWWNNEIDGIVTTRNELECNDKGSISDIGPSDKPCDKNLKNLCSDSFFKPYLDAQEGNEIYNFEESNEYSPQIPVPTECDVSNPDKLCKSKEFRIIRYSMGSDEEYITISLRPCCKEIDKLVTVYFGKRRMLNSYEHSDASSTHFCSRTQIGESSREKYQRSSSF